MKKLALLILAFIAIGAAAYSADIAVNGKLTTWAGVNVNATDFDSKNSDSVGYLYINGELNTTVKLAQNVTVLLELELNDKVSNGASMNSATDKTVEIDEANVEISEFLMDSLTVKIGHQYLYYSLRNNEKTMLLYDDFTAFKGTFKFDKGSLDVFYGKYLESLEINSKSSDQDTYGLHFEWNFNENIHTMFYLNHFTIDNPVVSEIKETTTLGAGIDYFLIDKRLELFLEVAAQKGSLNKTVDQSGFAFDAGARWAFGKLGSLKDLSLELNVGYRSGEDKKSDSTAFFNAPSATIGALIAEYNASDDSPMNVGYAFNRFLAVRGIVNADWSEKISSNLLFAYFGNTDESADPYGSEIDFSTSYNYSENVNMLIQAAIFMPDKKNALFPGKKDAVFALAFSTTVSF